MILFVFQTNYNLVSEAKMPLKLKHHRQRQRKLTSEEQMVCWSNNSNIHSKYSKDTHTQTHTQRNHRDKGVMCLYCNREPTESNVILKRDDIGGVLLAL